MHLPTDPVSAPPVLKIGAVVLRNSPIHPAPRSASEPHAAGSKGGKPPSIKELLILQPIPKTPDEMPPYVLTRGSRQYRDASGTWHDARDEATGIAHAATLEPFTRGLAREIEEEAGVTPAMLARATVVELGTLPFASRTKGTYPIHWFVVTLTEADAATITSTTPVDALATRWATLAEIKTMATQGNFSAGYIPVIEAALERVNAPPRNNERSTRISAGVERSR